MGNECEAYKGNNSRGTTNIRKALRLLIASESDMEIVGEVNNGFDALDMVGSLHRMF